MACISNNILESFPFLQILTSARIALAAHTLVRIQKAALCVTVLVTSHWILMDEHVWVCFSNYIPFNLSAAAAAAAAAADDDDDDDDDDDGND